MSCTGRATESVSKNVSLQVEEVLEHESWDFLEGDNLALLGNERKVYCHETQNASPPRPSMMWRVWWPNGSHWASGWVTLQSQRTFRVSWNTHSSAKCTTLSRTTIDPCSTPNGTDTATRHNETRSLSPKADGIMVLIRKCVCRTLRSVH